MLSVDEIILNTFASFLDGIEALIQVQLENAFRFEAETSAAALILLGTSLGRSVEKLRRLAATNYPAAACSGRAAFEIGLTADWLIAPDDVWLREGRWVGWFKGNERFYDQVSLTFKSSAPAVSEALANTASHYRQWRTAIESRLPHAQTESRPSVERMLGALGAQNLYVAYRGISQVMHAEPDSQRLVHRTEYEPVNPNETSAVFEAKSQQSMWGSFVNTEDWNLVYRMIGWALMTSSGRLSEILGTPEHLYEAAYNSYGKLDRLLGSG